MKDRDFERRLEELFSQDFSAGTETFRDALLDRCLEVLETDKDGVVLDDDVLDLLSAAGDVATLGAPSPRRGQQGFE